MSVFKDQKLKTKTNQEVDAVQALAHKEVILVYFSAHWCPPCRSFTPMLKDFYEELVEQEKPIAIVFVSSDRSEEDMNTYFQGDHGDWYVVPFGSTLAQTLKKNCNVSGIPMLVVVNNDGKMVHGDGRNDVTSGNPAAAFQKWKELVSK